MIKQNSNKTRTEYIQRLKNSQLLYFSELGRRIETGDITLAVIDSNKLEQLLKEYDLEAYQNDFLILASIIKEDTLEVKEMIDAKNRIRLAHLEIINALILLYSNPKQVAISFNHISESKKALIQTPYIIKKLRNKLLKMYIKNDSLFKIGKYKKEDITDWGNFLKDIKASDPFLNAKKGRTYKNEFLGFCVQEIFIFLHNFTELKAKNHTQITRKQSAFIYNYLKMIGIIQEDFAWKEDNIRHILEEYFSRDTGSPRDPEKWIKDRPLD
jgi:hypothetical protein